MYILSCPFVWLWFIFNEVYDLILEPDDLEAEMLEETEDKKHQSKESKKFPITVSEVWIKEKEDK